MRVLHSAISACASSGFSYPRTDPAGGLHVFFTVKGPGVMPSTSSVSSPVSACVASGFSYPLTNQADGLCAFLSFLRATPWRERVIYSDNASGDGPLTAERPDCRAAGRRFTFAAARGYRATKEVFGRELKPRQKAHLSPPALPTSVWNVHRAVSRRLAISFLLVSATLCRRRS